MALSPGEGRRLDLSVEPGSLVLSGVSYLPLSPTTGARLDVSRTVSGHAMRLRFVVEVGGPCARCLEQAEARLEIDAREVHQPSSGDEELESPYVADDELRLAAWAHDATVLAIPARFLCRPDCAGLCPDCGESLNDADPAAHRHATEPDPRWAKLRELKLD